MPSPTTLFKTLTKDSVNVNSLPVRCASEGDLQQNLRFCCVGSSAATRHARKHPLLHVAKRGAHCLCALPSPAFPRSHYLIPAAECGQSAHRVRSCGRNIRSLAPWLRTGLRASRGTFTCHRRQRAHGKHRWPTMLAGTPCHGTRNGRCVCGFLVGTRGNSRGTVLRNLGRLTNPQNDGFGRHTRLFLRALD